MGTTVLKRIKFIAHYPDLHSNKREKCSEASTTKIDYIVGALNKQGICVDLISMAMLSSSGLSFGGVKRNDDNNNTLRFFPTFKLKGLNRLARFFDRIIFSLWFLSNVKEGEHVIIYHSLMYAKWILSLKNIKQFVLISEVEEVYQDVKYYPSSVCETEWDYLHAVDKFITPSYTLEQKINTFTKPSIVIHGLYNLPDLEFQRFDDGKIHLLYSGIFDIYKGGAIAALEMIKYLPSNYHLHISGFGKDEDVKRVEELCQITKCNVGATVTYHGFVSRQELTGLMQQCHIGLCTQDPTTDLNLTSFPSKILNYMANGLSVFSGRSLSVENSDVGDLIYFYEEHNPESMAKSLQSMAVINPLVLRQRVKDLNDKFVNNISNFVTY